MNTNDSRNYQKFVNKNVSKNLGKQDPAIVQINIMNKFDKNLRIRNSHKIDDFKADFTIT